MKYKNYILLAVLLVVTVFLTFFLSSLYKSRNNVVSDFYEYCNKINSNEFDEFIIENPDSIIYIGDKNDLDFKEQESALKDEIEKKGLKNKIVYLEKSTLSKKFLSSLKSKYGKSINKKKTPVLLVVVDKKINKVVYLKDNLELNLKTLMQEQSRVNDDFFTKLEKEEVLNKELIMLKESLNTKELSQKTLQIALNEKKSEIAGSKNIINNKLDEELIRILEAFTKKSEEKTLLENELKDLKSKRDDLNNQINDLELKYRDNNSKYNKLQTELKEHEIEKGKLDVKLDNLLITLSENYNLTYEAADSKYSLDLEENIAREKVKTTKKALDDLGSVNLGSIDEYERLSKRYEFLENQKLDLEHASDELLNIISEMDEIMISKFKSSFESISKEFKTVFKTIFQGGKGELRLTNPDDLLTSGIEIIAEPPGKKINSTVALSGGEQSLTAICLLFAILNVRPVPFIILDEAEAALDEANVDMFGKYISEKKKESQFILITHKKRMMEYADTLYGITMQESGVSKIVSAKLED